VTFWEKYLALFAIIGPLLIVVSGKNIPHLALFNNKYPLQRDIFCMCEALLLFGWLGFGWSEVGLIWFGVVLLCSAIVAQLSCHYVPLLCFAQVLIFGYKVLRVVSLHCASYRFTLLVARRTKVLLLVVYLLLVLSLCRYTPCSSTRCVYFMSTRCRSPYSHIISLRSYMLVCLSCPCHVHVSSLFVLCTHVPRLTCTRPRLMCGT
jgi:hypothetical protein